MALSVAVAPGAEAAATTTTTAPKGHAANGFTMKPFVTGFPSSSIGPIGVAFGPDGRLYAADQSDGFVYRFGRDGGSANQGARFGDKHTDPTGLAFSSDGHLYLAEHNLHRVIELSPTDGSVIRTVADSLKCPVGLAVDPKSGDLFVSEKCGRNPIDRIVDPQGAATVTPFVMPDSEVDGMTFTPDGTLFFESGPSIERVSVTASTPVPVKVVSGLVSPDGVGVSAAASNGLPHFLLVNQNNGAVTKVDLSSSPPATTPIFTGGTRGDFVAVGPDGCLYATQLNSILRFTNADGTCDLATVAAIRGTHERSSFPSTLVSITHISKKAKDLARSALVGALFLLIVVFPAELFNSTLEANYDEIKGWFGPLNTAADRVGRMASGVPPIVAFALYAVIGSLIGGLLDPKFGADAASAALVVGLLVSFVAITLGFAYVERRYMRTRYNDPGRLSVLPGTIAIGAVCVLVSRLAGFQPGYLYGLLAGFVFIRELDRGEAGRVTARSALVVLAVSLAAWIVWTPFGHMAAHAHPGIFVLIVDAALAGIFVAGIESLVFGLVPLRFLEGEKLFGWNRLAWVGVYALGMFAFVHVLLHPGVAYQESPSGHAFVVALVLFVLFGGVSVALWAYFRRRTPAAPEPEEISSLADPVPPSRAGVGPS